MENSKLSGRVCVVEDEVVCVVLGQVESSLEGFVKRRRRVVEDSFQSGLAL